MRTFWTLPSEADSRLTASGAAVAPVTKSALAPSAKEIAILFIVVLQTRGSLQRPCWGVADQSLRAKGISSQRMRQRRVPIIQLIFEMGQTSVFCMNTLSGSGR